MSLCPAQSRPKLVGSQVCAVQPRKRRQPPPTALRDAEQLLCLCVEERLQAVVNRSDTPIDRKCTANETCVEIQHRDPRRHPEQEETEQQDRPKEGQIEDG